jgi:hypothetical protein
VCGEEHGLKVLSPNGFGVIRHSNVAFGSFEANVNVGVGSSLSAAGPELMTGSSGGVTMRHT